MTTGGMLRLTTIIRECGERSEGPDAQCKREHKVYLIHENKYMTTTKTWGAKGTKLGGAKGTNWGGGGGGNTLFTNTWLHTRYLQNIRYIHTHTTLFTKHK